MKSILQHFHCGKMREIMKCRMLLCIVLLTPAAVGAIDYFNNDDTTRNSPYLYSEIESLDFNIVYDNDYVAPSNNPIIDETTRNASDNQKPRDHPQTSHEYWSPPCDLSPSEIDTDEYEDRGSSPSIVASSVLYDGDCFVSSEAMMCNGGGGENMFVNYKDFYDDEPTDEDDDDDDDSDGHSSMLSTVSLLRSKSTTRREKIRYYAGGKSKNSNTKENAFTNKVVMLNNMLRLQDRLVQQHDRRQQCQRTKTLAFVRR